MYALVDLLSNDIHMYQTIIMLYIYNVMLYKFC